MNGGMDMVEQELVILMKREAQFKVLMESGIIRKLFANSQRNIDDFRESLPVILGSRSGETLCLFIGLQQIDSSGTGRTKLVSVGVKDAGFIPNIDHHFDENDCRIV